MKSDNNSPSTVISIIRLVCGAKNFTIGEYYPISEAEAKWLTDELSQWLQLPVIKKPWKKDS